MFYPYMCVEMCIYIHICIFIFMYYVVPQFMKIVQNIFRIVGQTAF